MIGNIRIVPNKDGPSWSYTILLNDIEISDLITGITVTFDVNKRPEVHITWVTNVELPENIQFLLSTSEDEAQE